MAYARLQIMLIWLSQWYFSILLKLNYCSDPFTGKKKKNRDVALKRKTEMFAFNFNLK